MSSKYYIENKEKICKKARELYKTEKYKEYAKKRRADPEIKEKRKEANKRWLAKNKNYYKEYGKRYRKTIKAKQSRTKYNTKRYALDIMFKLNVLVSQAIKNSLKSNKKGRHWEELVGYTVTDLKNHLEKQFEDWMSWENHGITSTKPKQTWQIDHIKPVNTFNITSLECEDFKTCWSLENLRPLDSYINVRRPKEGTDLN